MRARRGLLVSVLTGVIAVAGGWLLMSGTSTASGRRSLSAAQTRRVIAAATKHRVVGVAGTPTVHLRGLRDFDEGPARLGTGNRSHGNERVLATARKVPVGATRRSLARTSVVGAAHLGTLREVNSLRTADSDTYESSSGVYVARIYTQPVNYRSANGRFEPINDKLKRAGQVLVNRGDTDRLRLPLRLDRSISIKHAGTTIHFRLLGASNGARASVTGTAARYTHAYRGTAVSLRAVPGSLELSFALASRHAENTFRIKVSVPRGLHARLRQHALRLLTAVGQTRFQVPVPLMLEHAGRGLEPSYSGADRIHVTLTHQGRSVVLAYSISRGWLDAQRRFPIVLDPQAISSGGVASSDCTVFSNDKSNTPDPDCSANGADDIVGAAYDTGGGTGGVGATDGTYVTMINFPTDPGNIPADDEILGASLSVDVHQVQGAPVSFTVLPMSDSFTAGEANWLYANVATGDKWACPGGGYVGCQTGAPTSIAGSSQLQGPLTGSGTATIGITALVQNWIDGSQPAWQSSSGTRYLPVELYPTSAGGLADIYSTTNTSGAAKPTLTIEYDPRLGGDPGSTIPATSIDQNTSLGINVANGDVQVQRSDLDVTGTAGLNLSLSHAYNSRSSSGGWSDQPPSLSSYASDAEVLTGADGNESVWNSAPTSTWGEGGTYTPPPGTNGSLCESLPNGNPTSISDPVASGPDPEAGTWVFWVGGSGQISGDYQLSSTDWYGDTPTTGTGAATAISTVAPNSSPSAVVDSSGNIAVFYVDVNHQLAYWRLSGGTWTDQQISGGIVGVDTSPSAVLNSSGQPYVYFNDGLGHIDEWSNTGSGWSLFLILTTSGENAAPYTSPAAGFDSNNDRAVFYVDDGNSDGDSARGYQIGQFWLSAGGSWNWQPLGVNLSASTTAVAAYTSPSFFMTPAGAGYVFYTGSNDQINELDVPDSWGYGSWSWSQPSSTGGPTSVAPTTSPSVMLDSSSDLHVYYTGSDGHLSQFSQSGGSWVTQDPLSDSVAPDTDPVVASVSTSNQSVFYVGSNGQLHDAYWNGSAWNDQPLINGSVGVGSCQPKDADGGAIWELTNYSSGERLDFNPGGQLIAVYDRNGNSLLYTYNTNGTVNQITDSQGRTYSYSYSGSQTTITDNAGGRTITLNLNSSSTTGDDVDAAGNRTNYTYNANGLLSTITDPNTVGTPGDDGTTTITYPTVSATELWEVQIQRPAPTAPGSYATTTYISYPQSTPPPPGLQSCGGSPSGELAYGYTVVTSPDGNWREYCYDTHDRVYETFDQVTKQPTTTSYDANDDVTGVVDPTNTEFGSPTIVTSATFDACFRPTSETSGTGANAPTTTETYINPATSSCTATSPQDYEPQTSTQPAGSKNAPTTIHYTYDGNGNLKSEVDGLSAQNLLSFDYNANGTLADSWNAVGQETRYTYVWGQGPGTCGASGNLDCYPGVLASTTVSPPTPQAPSTTTYDLDGRVLTSTDGDNNKVTIPSTGGYDGDDNVLLAQYSNNAAAYQSAVLANSPAVFWKLGESQCCTAADGSGHGVTGTYGSSGVGYGVAGATTDGATGISVNGSTNGATGSPASLPSGNASRSVEEWFKTTDTSAQSLMSYGANSANELFSVILDDGSSPTLTLTNYGSNYNVTLPYSVTNNQWHQIVVTWAGTSDQLTVYLDGQQIGQETEPALNTSTGSGAFLAASGIPGNGFNFEGDIQAMSIYPTVLTPANVTSHYQAATTNYQTGSTTDVYDADGNLLHAADTQSGETGTTCYSYMANGQLDIEQDQVAPGQTGAGTGTGSCNGEDVTSTTYAYNNNGDMTSLGDGGGTVSYGYDNDDRVSSITQPGTSTPFTFTYDNDGRLVCTTYPNGMVSEQLYDAYNNLTDLQTANGTASCNQASTTGTPTGTVFQNNAYTYASGSDLQQSQTITQNGTSTAWNYYYDALNRLIEVSGNGSAGTYNYSYDGDGNLLQRTTNASTGAYQTATYNSDNELSGLNTYSDTGSSTGSYSATYDSAGNMQTLGSASGTTTLGYNDQEQTTSINPYATGAQTLGYRGKGQNDPFQIGNQPTGGAAPGLEDDALGISAQYPVSSSGSTPTSSYTYYTRGPRGALLAERGGGGSTSADDYYYVQDANDSVVALTNSSDAIANTYTYDPYGTTTASTGSAPNPFGFDGGYYANCSSTSGTGANCPSSTTTQGLILFGTRYYDPTIGMWTQPDPDAQSLVTDPTQSDAYGFTGDDPINDTDTSGLNCFDPNMGSEAGPAESIGEYNANITAYEEFTSANATEEGAGPSASPNFSNPSEPPGPGWEWRGKGAPGSSQGSWYNPSTDESLHPDLGHGPPLGPHYDYVAPNGTPYRLYPDGSLVPK
jgi:RHS repeat-associated protein